jgi:hypothetical protein
MTKKDDLLGKPSSIEMAKDIYSTLENPVLRQKHADLIAEFCTIKKRAYVDGYPTFSIPPHYGEVGSETIILEEYPSKTRAYIDVKCQRIIYRFVVQKKKDGWRIDSIKWKSNWEGYETEEWKNGLIGTP